VFQVHVHNQCSDFELISPTYFGHNAIWHTPPNQKVDANTMRSAILGRDVTKSKFAGALIYRLQKKHSEPSVDNIKRISVGFQLLVMWGLNTRRRNDRYNVSACAMLIKNSNAMTWGEDKLRRLYSMHRARLDNEHNTKSVWLLSDVIVMITKAKWINKNYVFEIAISEGTKEDRFLASPCITASI
jgi:hypothetical protein